MNATERQYERIARKLDGEDIHLTDDERELADALARDERAVRASLDVAVPFGAVARARRRAESTLAARRRWRRVAIPIAAAGVAAAAAIVIVSLLSLRSGPAPSRPGEHPPAIAQTPPPEVLKDSADAEIAMLSRDVDRLEAEMHLTNPPVVADVELDSLEHDVDEFWAPPSDVPAPAGAIETPPRPDEDR